MSHSTSHILLKGELYEALIEVRDVVSAGWVRHTMETPDGCCLIGAVGRVARLRNTGLYYPLVEALGFTNVADGMDWNDFKAKDQSDVIQRIDDAIRRVVETT